MVDSKLEDRVAKLERLICEGNDNYNKALDAITNIENAISDLYSIADDFSDNNLYDTVLYQLKLKLSSVKAIVNRAYKNEKQLIKNELLGGLFGSKKISADDINDWGKRLKASLPSDIEKVTAPKVKDGMPYYVVSIKDGDKLDGLQFIVGPLKGDTSQMYCTAMLSNNSKQAGMKDKFKFSDRNGLKKVSEYIKARVAEMRKAKQSNSSLLRKKSNCKLEAVTMREPEIDFLSKELTRLLKNTDFNVDDIVYDDNDPYFIEVIIHDNATDEDISYNVTADDYNNFKVSLDGSSQLVECESLYEVAEAISSDLI